VRRPRTDRTRPPVDSVRYVIIRDARPDEHAAVGELRVSAYRALGLLPDGSAYAETLRGFGFGGDCTVLVAVDEADDSLIGTVTLEPFDSASELAQDDTEADVRAFAVAAQAQGKGVGANCCSPPSSTRKNTGCAGCAFAPSRPCWPRSTSTRPLDSHERRNSTSPPGQDSCSGPTNLTSGPDRYFGRHGGSHLSPPAPAAIRRSRRAGISARRDV